MKKKLFFIIILLVVILLLLVFLKNRDIANNPIEQSDYYPIENLEPDIEIFDDNYHRMMDISSGDSFKIYPSKKLVLKTTNTYNLSTGSNNTTTLYRISNSNLDNIMNLIDSMNADTENGTFFYPIEQLPFLSEEIDDRLEQYYTDLSLPSKYYRLNYKNNTYFILDENKQNILKENLEFAN